MRPDIELHGRSQPEWIGKDENTPVPGHVKLRIFRRHNGICHISGRKITPADKWDADHVIALCNGGQNRESNLAPAIVAKHKEKTADDVAEKAHVDAIAKKHFGIKRRKRKWPSRKFNGEIRYDR